MNAPQLPLFGQAQRWECGRASYRPAGETIRPAEYDVAPVLEVEARAFVLGHHYAGTYPAARFRFGLHHRGALVGVAVFSHPVNDAVLTGPFPGEARAAVELGRFVLLDAVPGNGETFFLGRAFAQLRAAGVRGVVSFADPVARRGADGRLVFPGHLGTIYQAHNGRYLGRGTARTLRLLPDGRVFNERAAQKVRGQERGWRAVAAVLEAAGADPVGAQEPAGWLRCWVPQLTRPLRHPGCHKYAWSLTRRAPVVGAVYPYPKREE